VFVATIIQTNVVGQASKTYRIESRGTVKGMSRTIIIEGGRFKTWAKYALWSHNNRQIYFKSGEKFYGPVHANNQLWFSGDPEFFATVTSGASTYGGSTNSCIFHEGFWMNAATNSMAEVDFPDLRSKASLIVTGATTIVFQGTNMVVSNPDRGWVNQVMSVPADAVIYTSTEGAQTGTMDVQGTLDGRITIVADQDIEITDNLTYVDDPATNSASDDALGLISGRDIIVKTSFPDNGKIYAHMMATGNATPGVDTDGSFGVENAYTRSPSGFLNVWGGIVQHYRGVVGTFSWSSLTSGFEKNYTYDTRFATDPPPEYPPLDDEFLWDKWRDEAS